MSGKHPAMSAWIVASASILFVVGCHKQVAHNTPPQPAPAPLAAQPAVALTAAPNHISVGGSTTLTWSSTNASQLSLTPGIGTVGTQGSLQVRPGESTVYTLTGSNPSGSVVASASVTVSVPPSPAAAVAPDVNALFAQQVKDDFFNYDRADILADDRTTLTRDAEFLRTYPSLQVVIEGHCDERGSEEYNLALGDRRATATKGYLVSLGIPADQIRTSSVGKEKPFCTASSESCWKQNRRGHFERLQ